MIELYCGLTERSWNTIPVPDDIGPFMVAANNDSVVGMRSGETILDSGAYGDRPGERLSFQGALDRQFAFEERNSFRCSHFVPYDLLIDEKWDGAGIRHKKRWSEEEAWKAVAETIKANEFLAQADLQERKRVCVLQGVTARQQIYCAGAVIPMAKDTDKILGLGGWCIIGFSPPASEQRRSLEWTFWDTMWRIVPRVAKAGVEHIHIFGVMEPGILGGLLWLCDEHGIAKVSTDSSGPHKRPAATGWWGYGDWARRCYFPPGPLRGFARIEHVRQVRSWLARFRETQYYKCPPKPNGYQLRLF